MSGKKSSDAWNCRRGVPTAFSNARKTESEFFQGLEKYLPRFGRAEWKFSNAWNETFQALEI
jgi:hypothetical protein